MLKVLFLVSCAFVLIASLPTPADKEAVKKELQGFDVDEVQGANFDLVKADESNKRVRRGWGSFSNSFEHGFGWGGNRGYNINQGWGNRGWGNQGWANRGWGNRGWGNQGWGRRSFGGGWGGRLGYDSGSFSLESWGK